MIRPVVVLFKQEACVGSDIRRRFRHHDNTSTFMDYCFEFCNLAAILLAFYFSYIECGCVVWPRQSFLQHCHNVASNVVTRKNIPCYSIYFTLNGTELH